MAGPPPEARWAAGREFPPSRVGAGGFRRAPPAQPEAGEPAGRGRCGRDAADGAEAAGRREHQHHRHLRSQRRHRGPVDGGDEPDLVAVELRGAAEGGAGRPRASLRVRRVPVRRRQGRPPGGQRRAGRAHGAAGGQPPAGGVLRPAGPLRGLRRTVRGPLRPGGPSVSGGVPGLQRWAGREVGRTGPAGRADPGLRPRRDERPGRRAGAAGSAISLLPVGRAQLRPPRGGAGHRQLHQEI